MRWSWSERPLETAARGQGPRAGRSTSSRSRSPSPYCRVKALLLESVGQHEAAQQTFATSVALCRQLQDAWMSWGQFCDRGFKVRRRKRKLPSAAPLGEQGGGCGKAERTLRRPASQDARTRAVHNRPPQEHRCLRPPLVRVRMSGCAGLSWKQPA